MITEHLTQLLVKYFSGKADSGEVAELEQWRKENPENEKAFLDYQSIWRRAEPVPVHFNPDAEIALATVKERLSRRQSAVFTLPLAMKIAAAISLLVVSVWMIQTVKIKEPANVFTITFETHEREIKDVTLPDGTVVSMNSRSLVRCPSEFRGDSREVYFEGEGYFKVEKDPAKPFIISATHSQVKVLGTEFNLRARAGEEEVKIAVTEGKVEFSKNHNEPVAVMLTTGESASLSKSASMITRESIENENFLSWKTGRLVFRETPLTRVTRDLSDHFNVSIQVADPAIEGKTLTATFDGLSLKEALRIIELSINLKADTVGNEIRITGKEQAF